MKQAFDLVHLVFGKELRGELIDAELSCHRLRDFLTVTGKHDGFLHARGMQRGYGDLSIGFHHVRDDDMPRILAVD